VDNEPVVADIPETNHTSMLLGTMSLQDSGRLQTQTGKKILMKHQNDSSATTSTTQQPSTSTTDSNTRTSLERKLQWSVEQLNRETDVDKCMKLLELIQKLNATIREIS
jgi:predicted house-cleaning noncanonical NTP pyrophosphatase (MazG superfamily)